MRTRSAFFGLSLLSLVSSSVWAETCAPCLYPIKEVIGWPSAQKTRPALDPLFIAAYPAGAGRGQLGRLFSQRFQSAFPDVVTAQIGSENKLKSFVASLHVQRASHYVVKKIDKTADHYLPVTLSIIFTNPLTGEVMDTITETRYTQLTLLQNLDPAQVRARLIAAYRSNVEELMSALIEKAKVDFQPFKLVAEVKKSTSGYLILDKGRTEGLTESDQLTDSQGQVIQVLYASDKYAVAVPVLVKGSVGTGTAFFRYETQKNDDIQKPRVLLIHTAQQASGLQQLAEQLFGDLLQEAKAGFALTPVNLDFQAVLNAIDRETMIGQHAVKENRLLPEFFLRVKVLQPIHYTLPGEHASVELHHTTVRLVAELVDASGRVIHSDVAEETIEDKVVMGQGFAQASRSEVAMKNALMTLAKKFAQEVKLESHSLSVSSASSRGIEVEDAKESLQLGQQVRIFRSIGPVSGVSGEVSVPLMNTSVSLHQNGQATLAQSLALFKGAPSPQSGDAVTFLSEKGISNDRDRYTLCLLEKVQLGAIHHENYVPLAQALTGKHLKHNFYVEPQRFSSDIRNLIQHAGFRAQLTQQPLKAEHCLEPVYRFSASDKGCQGQWCSVELDSAMGLRIRKKGTQAVSNAQSVRSTEQIPQRAFAETKTQIERNRFDETILKLLPSVIENIR